ncbi:hypothetical protein [Methylorubrum extorquens]|uniref:hypothetical protein n=1 Tax=Methylorubrum extorquens TaxID=408 RepID=UPI000A6A8584|nr:hypothetical protein [Methylorubrum extorquens]WIU38782.1 hypothetical protein KQ926_19670 [Methylorubrum extorquens]
MKQSVLHSAMGFARFPFPERSKYRFLHAAGILRGALIADIGSAIERTRPHIGDW